MPAVSTVRVSVDFGDKLKAATAKLIKQEVLVGVPDSTAERQPEPGEKNPPSNALIGYVMEFGAPDKNIPARPFLVPGVENAKDDIVRRLQQAAKGALDGNADAVEDGFTAVGFVAQNAVRQKMTEGPFTPLADATINARLAKGRTGDKPLIDSGQLRSAITFVVRDR